MKNLIPIFLITAVVFLGITIGSVSVDMPYENTMEESFLGGSVADIDFCVGEESYNSSEDTTDCEQHVDASHLKWYNFAYGFLGILAISGSIVVFALGLRMLLWLIWLAR